MKEARYFQLYCMKMQIKIIKTEVNELIFTRYLNL